MEEDIFDGAPFDIIFSVTPIIGLVVMCLGLLMWVFQRMAHGYSTGGAPAMIVIGFIISFTPWMTRFMFRLFYIEESQDDESQDDEAEEEEPAPEPEPEPAPESSEPVDLTWMLYVGALLVGLAALAALIYGIYRIAASAKRKREAEKKASAETAAKWAAAKERHAEAITTVASYEIDVAKAIDYPAFNDISVPEVSAMSKAMRRARDIEFQIDKNEDIGGSDDLLKTYRDAVDEFVTAVEVAEAKAKQIRWKSIPKEERKDLKLAKKLLAQAEDPGNPENVRHNLYERLKKVIDRLNDSHGSTLVPNKTIGQIEEQTRLLLEAPEVGVTAEDLSQSEAIRL